MFMWALDHLLFHDDDDDDDDDDDLSHLRVDIE